MDDGLVEEVRADRDALDLDVFDDDEEEEEEEEEDPAPVQDI